MEMNNNTPSTTVAAIREFSVLVILICDCGCGCGCGTCDGRAVGVGGTIGDQMADGVCIVCAVIYAVGLSDGNADQETVELIGDQVAEAVLDKDSDGLIVTVSVVVAGAVKE
jgi:hypothetical protein